MGVRSDSKYGNKTRDHPLFLTDQQVPNQENERSARNAADTTETAGPSVSAFQRAGDKNTKRYRLLKYQIILESEHTLTMSNDQLLRKSGAVIRKSSATCRHARKHVPKPPTPQDLQKKLAAKGTSYVVPQVRQFEPENETELDEEDHQPLNTRRTASGKLPAVTMPPVDRWSSETEMQVMAEVIGENTEKGEKRTTENEAKKRVSKGAETALKENSATERPNKALREEVAPMVQSTSAPSGKICGTAKREKK